MLKKLKRSICFILAFTLLSTFTVYAEMDANADNNNNQSVTTGAGGDFGANGTDGRIGVRFSLVYKNDCEKVASINENGEPLVIDILYTNRDRFNYYIGGEYISPLLSQYIYSAVKTQSINSQNKIKLATWDEIQQVKGLNTMPHWMTYENSRYVGHGKEFEYWERNNNFYNLKSLLAWTDEKGSLIFKTAYTKDKIGADGKAMTVFDDGLPEEEEVVLLVEPLIYFTPVLPNTKANIIHTKFYGTISNIAEAWCEEGLTKYTNLYFAQCGHLNYKAFNQVAHCTFATTINGYTFRDGKRITTYIDYKTGQPIQGQQEWEVLANWNIWEDYGEGYGICKNGYGINIFDPKSLTEQQEVGQKVNIIKVYRENGNIIETKQETTNTTVYNITDEEGYKYTENKKSDDDPLQNIETWEQVTGSTSTENTVTVEESTKTIYILYDKTDIATKQLVLHENELSYTYSLKGLVADGGLASIYDTIKSATQAGATRPSCGGHGCGDEDCSSNHKCNSDDKYLSDNTFIVSVKNDFNYNDTAFIKDFVADNSTLKAQGKATWAGGTGESYKVEPYADFLLYRDKEKDLVTLYPSKNDALLSDLNSLGISNISYKPSFTRIAKESTSKYFTDNFITNWTYAEDRDTGLAWNWVRSGSYGSHTEDGNYDTETATGHSPQDANALYSQTGNIKENYFLGKANTATDAPQPWYGLGLENYSQNKANSIASAELKFYPYFKMLYHAKGDNSTAQEVAVTSENISTMRVYNTAILGVKKNTLPNVNVTSTQWSTHARSLKFLQNKQIKDKKSVLTGGSILNLDTLQAGNTELGIRLYLSCLPDGQVGAVADGSFNTSETQARQLAEAYKNQVKSVLEGYGLVQYAKAGFTTERKDLLKQGKLLEANKKVELGNRLFTTNSDEKYYLRQNGAGAGRANLDILNVTEDIHIYTVKSDWDGNIWVEKDGMAITEKTKDLNALLSNAEIDVLNKNTKVVSNFYNCLDHAGGKDRQGETWYNEAFDGVSVLVSDLRYSLGFNADLQRSTVLDPTLQGVAQSKSDLYNFDDTMLNNTLRTSCFFTTAKSTATEAEGKNAGYIGTVAGNSTIGALNTSLSDIQYLMFSKLFYITNANVSDLN